MKQFFQKKIQLSLLWRVLLCLGLSGIILAFCIALQAGSVVNTLKNFLRDPRLLALNLFPILALLTLFSALLGNVFWGSSLTALLVNILSLINLIKIECRNDPLVPPDFALLGEAMVATGEYRLNLHIPYILVILVFSALLSLLGFKFKMKLLPWKRIIIGVLCVALFIAGLFTVYESGDLYRSLIGNVDGLSLANVPIVFDELGFPYCFLHNYRLYEVQKPAGYKQAEVEAWTKGGANASAFPVDVVFVQCEAFSDFYEAEAFDYTEQTHPMYRFREVAASPQSISGRIVVSNFGAGTANTEFDIMTGIETNMLNEVTTSAFRVVHKHMSSLARTFQAQGYVDWFMHPGERWFYNRESVYDHFGIQNQTYVDSFVGYGMKGCYISDKSFGEKLMEQYRAVKAASDAPWFAFTVTIQNHQSYRWEKYSERPEDAPIRHAVSDETMELASVYAEGIRDSSELLYNLTQFFDKQEDPLILVFWGDHLPTLGSNFLGYQEIGLDIGNEAELDSALDTYSTPFVIWANRAYCDQYDFSARKEALALPSGKRISDIYLGELVYELCGMQGADPYWDYLGEARRILPVICKGRYELPDGTKTDTLSPEQQAVEDKLRKWGYYRVMDEHIS